MDNQEFVEAIRLVVEDSSVEGSVDVFENPPGRNPSPDLLVLSNWFLGLSEKDQQMVIQSMRYAVRTAVFGFFCVLDGVRTIEDTREKGNFELLFRKGRKVTRLNPPDGEFLHDLYMAI